MSTKYPDLFAALAAPFEPDEVKIRSLTNAGRQIHYVTARTVMNRFDNVLGPENWFDEYVPGENSVLCRLTITLPDGSRLSKCDAGGYAGMSDEGDDDKSGYSDAFKRAAVKFLVGRYLYRDGVPCFTPANPEPATVTELLDRERRPAQVPAQIAATPPTNGHANGHVNGKARHDWPGASDPRNAPAPKQTSTPVADRASGPPKTGKALFAWVKEQEQRYELALLRYANNWAKLQEFPGRMVEWNAEQVALCHAELLRKIASTSGDQQD